MKTWLAIALTALVTLTAALSVALNTDDWLGLTDPTARIVYPVLMGLIGYLAAGTVMRLLFSRLLFVRSIRALQAKR